MPSYLYQVANNHYTQIDTISLSGWRGLIYRLYAHKNIANQLSEEIDGIGWEISKTELQEQIARDEWGDGIFEVVFDIEPSKKRTNLLQLEHLYIFSHNYEEVDGIYWSVLMLELKPILFHGNILEDKASFTPNGTNEKIMEFLYLRGDEAGWTYGTLGRMNGALLESSARDYFRKYF